MSLMNSLSSTAFALGLLGLGLHRKYLVSALLCLEAMMLALFITLMALPQATLMTTSISHPLLLLALAACGAGAGLGLVVAITRTHATSQLKNLNLLKC